MDNDIFINIGLDTTIKRYLLYRKTNDAVLAQDYLVYVMFMLNYIYGETDIINPYINRQNNGKEAIGKNFAKYGASKKVIVKFLNDLNGYVEYEKNKIEKNPFFSFIQEDLIDLFLAKKKSDNLDDKKLKEFRNLLFSPETTNNSRKELNEKCAYDIWHSINYLEYQLYKENKEITWMPLKKNMLDNKVYNIFGISNENLNLLNQQTLNEINNSIYEYYKINPISVNAKEKVLDETNKMINTNLKLSTNSGKVNALIFLSVFVILIGLGVVIGLFFIR